MPSYRLIRRKPLLERIMSQLNPMDFLLWVSEEIETREWDSTLSGTQLGMGMNLFFLLARANSALSEPSDSDVFGDDVSSGWLSWLLFPIIWGLVALSCTNAIYALSRTRKYRVFQSKFDLAAATPSARRVKAPSASTSSSPLRYFAELLTSESAESRAANADKAHDSWELSVWDPLPATLRLFCLFSPGHVLVYLLFLPLAPLDPQPSVTVFNVVVMQLLLSGQMLLLSSRFAQQVKDNSIVQREVMNEYETKFVQPRLHPVVRDVGTQVGSSASGNQELLKIHNFVQLGTPTTVVRPAFLSRPKPVLSREELLARSSPASVANVKPEAETPPLPAPKQPETAMASVNPRASSIVKPSATDDGASFPVPGNMISASTNTGSAATFGGHMGIYNHARSPLKKAAYMNDFAGQETASPRNSREMAAYEQRIMARPVSPIKQPELRRMTGAGAGAGATGVSAPFAMGGTREGQLPRW
ncbi:Meiotically up-regulated protein [Escovopsis weberi]|uniref:Meiotically up-regulated protein n=1 Tax=Escovopsis weberi TaxID=150374 RepID=A0A0M9VSQ8_ESCWE|nr:Meiotically up-regulated protein [Escovopsis weberi]